ncbi:MAG: flagellar motor protein [Gammaproteobacteria bacterium]|nr:flagellar motor protein [Gammaproteobacteria bacterium]MDE2252555.1 flagellar motor protein [Gammaproteobacteria bacterium]
MDILSLIGVVLAGTAILAGAVLKGAGLHALLSWAAFMIVMVGTLAAICVQTPLEVMRRALVMLPWVFRPPARTPEAQIRKLVDWSGISRKQGLLGLEPVLGREADPFLRRGLQLVVDGNSPDAIRATLEVDMHVRETADLRAARVFEGMGVYSPTLGIIGAVLGLMAVMQHLADPSELGHGIAAAFTATVYGIGLANLLFLPMANKLKVAVHAHAHVHAMLIEGLIGIAQGDNPRSIDTRLRSYLS